ncbi:hypothetical protein [Staphylococcus phage VB-SauS-SA2]|nr:hypothetical protein [Staphylococcus phage VB-SauS-SA2]
MISVQIAMKLKRIVREQVEDIIPSKHVYLYNIPEDVDRLQTLPFIRINHITSTATTHSSNQLDFTRERFQVQYFYDDEDDNDIEGLISNLDNVLRENGFYYSTGYDSFDPDLDGVITVTRQYNYRNNLLNN